ncbi:MAG: M18 family aminopeptidase [Oscillospiraceae bacterium]|nr:M18 family aminopeptidase [Oscillospiraceae bacterium]
MDKRIEALIDFLDNAHSVFHAVAGLEKVLLDAGYQALNEWNAWDLIPGGKYYLKRNDSAILAFRIPQGNPKGFLLSASHADRPCFKVKENGELKGAYTRLAVERYGGMLISPWLDRPLSVAGRVMVETESGIESRLVDIDRDLLLIPNVAIHMNRQANDGYKWNPAVDTLPLMGSKEAAGKFQTILEEAAGGKILGHDLYLYIRQKASVWGLEEEYISSAALDDLECAWCCTQGFLNAAESSAIPVLSVFDSEEVGSASLQGAASDLLEVTLQRICSCLNLPLPQMLAQSFMVSADNAHAIHPNHPELADAANTPVMGKGVVLKYNANQRYTSDGVSAAIFRKVCAKAEVPVQTYCNRADLPGGSTLGNISLAHVSVPSVDIGLPQLAMHSCYETAAISDAIALENAMAAYYGAALERTASGYTLK